MKHSLLSAAAIAAMCWSVNVANAETPASDGPKAMEGKMNHEKAGDHHMEGKGKMDGMERHHREPAKSRQEAIERSKEYTTRLEKMTDAEWKEKQERRQERHEKWKEASPEERQKMKDHMKEKREKKELPGEPK